MNYIRESMPLRRWDREEIIKSEDSIIEFLKFKGFKSFFLLTGIYAGTKMANYLLSLARKEDKVNEEAVQYWIGVIKAGKMFYYGGHSTIHIDDEGYLMDWHEKLSAIARCGITDRRLMPSINIHLGMFAFLHSTIRANETPVAPVQAFKSVPSIDSSTKEVLTKFVVPKVPEYVAKYPSKSISLIMAMLVGDITVKYNRKQTAIWEEKNDSSLLEECLQEGERLSKVSARFLTATEWGALRYITTANYEDESSVFFTLIQAETRLKPAHPISMLRHQFGVSSNYVARDFIYRMNLVIKAWNSYATKTDLSTNWHVWDRDKEAFPKAV